MGFSVSGSAAIIFAAMFIAFGTFHSASTNGFETISDAQEDRTDRTLVKQNTDINLTSAVWNGSAGTDGELTVTVDNTGSTELTIDAVDLLANNEYLQDYNTSVAGNSETNLWLPQEELTITVSALGSDPSRVKLVTGPGVAETQSTVVV